MRNGRLISFTVATLVLAVTAAACRAASTSTTSGPVVIHLADQGNTVTIHRGQHMVLSLGASSPSDRAETWTLALYPEHLLRLLFRSALRGRFEFEAVAAGNGKILAITRLRGTRCGPPGAVSPQCLLSRQAAGSVPPRPVSFVVSIRVVP